jgi:hypothetical protein
MEIKEAAAERKSFAAAENRQVKGGRRKAMPRKDRAWEEGKLTQDNVGKRGSGSGAASRTWRA